MHSGLRIAVCGAAGFAGALCASLVQRHPQLELTLLTARSDAGKRHDELYPRYRVPLEMHDFDAGAVWLLEPDGTGHTRLITRLRSRYGWTRPTIVTELLLMEIGDLFMMRKCLLGIKQRAEQLASGRRFQR